MEWGDQSIATLRQLWGDGLSTGEIGRRMHISKNAIVGKAHRLKLPPRPSPIKRDGGGMAEVKPRVQRLTRAVSVHGVAEVVPIEKIRRAEKEHAPIVQVASVFVGPVKRCCWPIGEPRKPSFHFCGAGSLPGKPYCEAHAAIAYVSLRDRREDAA